MDIKQLMDSVYLLPALLKYMANTTDKSAKRFLEEYDISDNNIAEFEKIKTLLQYHLAAAVKLSYPIALNPTYNLLRNGLESYFHYYLSHMFRAAGLINKVWSVLDYGCGAGQIGKQFKIDNPLSDVFYLDREKPLDIEDNRFLKIDFERYPEWYYGSEKFFDCVIMSELLHCKNTPGQHHLINSAHKILKNEGKLIIVENIDFCMAFRINQLKDSASYASYDIVTADKLKYLTDTYFSKLQVLTIQNHNIYVYEKI